MSDRLKLSDPRGNAELDRISDADELTENQKYIRQLEANLAELEKELAAKRAARERERQERQAARQAAAGNRSGGARTGARKDASFKAIGTAPSINRTPVGPTMVAIPYPTVQDLSNSVGTAKSVRFNGCPVYLLDSSSQPSGKGDERGTGKGIKSGTVSGEIRPVEGSGTVFVEGKKVVREGDTCTMNGGNNPGIFVTTPATSTAPPGTAIDTSDPRPAEAAARLAENVKAFRMAPANEDGLLPKTPMQRLLQKAMDDSLSCRIPGPFPPSESLSLQAAKAMISNAAVQRWLSGPALVNGHGDPRPLAQRFADEYGQLYDSSLSGATYSTIWLLGGSDRDGRTLSEIIAGVEGALAASMVGVSMNRTAAGKGTSSTVKSGNGVKIRSATSAQPVTVRDASTLTTARRPERASAEQWLTDSLGSNIKANPLRQEYEQKVSKLSSYIGRIRPGMSQTELRDLASEANQARRQLGVQYKNLTPEPLRDFIYQINQDRYGDPLGPNVDYLVKQGRTYTDIIKSASRPNPDVDTLLGKFGEWLKQQPDSYIQKHTHLAGE
jgi:uncharacterized Zn-binding protein involved in type VI secretion